MGGVMVGWIVMVLVVFFGLVVILDTLEDILKELKRIRRRTQQ